MLRTQEESNFVFHQIYYRSVNYTVKSWAADQTGGVPDPDPTLDKNSDPTVNKNRILIRPSKSNPDADPNL